MVKCSEYAYSNPNANLTNPISVHTYGYAMSGFGDLLTSYDNVSFSYDNIGNPTSYYNGNSYYFVWSGRQMVNAFFNSIFYTMSYDDNGVRQSKIVAGGVETYYIYDGTQLISEYNSLGELILYLYDATGSVIGMQYRDATYMPNVWDVYWFDKNPQGDVVGIFNTEGVLLAKYSYDAWGKFTTTYYNGGENTTATKNNITYRGYYYDRDFGLYYLITRYYDPVVKRFINADCYVSTGQDFTGYNMFAYCNNNPVMYVDPNGELLLEFLTLLAVCSSTASAALPIALPKIIKANTEVYVETEKAVATSNVEPMGDETFKQYDEEKESTCCMSREEQIAYIRKVRLNAIKAEKNWVNNWTEGEMLRELIYHEKGYRIAVFLGFDPNEKDSLANRLKYVNYEEEQNFISYFFRIVGNAIPG